MNCTLSFFFSLPVPLARPAASLDDNAADEADEANVPLANLCFVDETIDGLRFIVMRSLLYSIRVLLIIFLYFSNRLIKNKITL